MSLHNELEESLESLIEALRGNTETVRADAAKALGEIGDMRAVEPLIAALNERDDKDQRTAVLTGIRDARALEHRRSAEALGKIGDARAVDPLIAALEWGYFGVCQSAAEALGRIGDARAVEPLIAVIMSARRYGLDEQERRTRIRNARLGSTNPFPRFVFLDDWPLDNCWGARASACEALGRIGDVRAVGTLTAALNDMNPRVRDAAARALKELGECT